MRPAIDPFPLTINCKKVQKTDVKFSSEYCIKAHIVLVSLISLQTSPLTIGGHFFLSSSRIIRKRTKLKIVPKRS